MLNKGARTMTKINKDKLKKLKSEFLKTPKNWIKVGMSTCGIAAGADVVLETLKQEVEKRQLDVVVSQCGCAGKCYAEPLVEVCTEGLPQVIYGNIDQKSAMEIIERHIGNKQLLNDHIYNVKGK
jgi:(2Fe-2S) ferredoxin